MPRPGISFRPFVTPLSVRPVRVTGWQYNTLAVTVEDRNAAAIRLD